MKNLQCAVLSRRSLPIVVAIAAISVAQPAIGSEEHQRLASLDASTLGLVRAAGYEWATANRQAPAMEANAATEPCQNELPQCFEVDPSPLGAGAFWTYEKNGLNAQTETVLSGTFFVNGAATQAIEVQGGEFSGSRFFISRDSSGAALHRTFTKNLFIEGFGFVDRTVTFSPSIATPPSFCIGDITENSGTAFYSFSDGSSFTLNYTSTSRPVGYANVVVPFGEFTALETQGAFRVFGNVNGTPIDEPSTSVGWSVSGIGNVKSESTENDQTNVFELIDTNQSATPGPPDQDGDDAPDHCDNCSLVVNSEQVDADGDGIGNACDGDFDQSGATTIVDFNVLRACFNKLAPASIPPGEPARTEDPSCMESDMDGSGVVTIVDFNLFRLEFNTAPGPSANVP